MQSKIEHYIFEHTSPEKDILSELSRETQHKILLSRMLSGHIQGKWLELISHMIKPENVLEIGTFTGYSAICLAQGLQNSGMIHTIEVNDELENFILKYLKKSGLEDKIKLYIGDALKIIPTFDIHFDLVFIDGDKREYLKYYNSIFDKVKPGGFILADNVLWNNKVIAPLKPNDDYTAGILEFNKYIQADKRVENMILPLRDGIMLIRKK